MKILIKKSGRTVKNENVTNKKQSIFMENLWAADLADVQLISKFTKGFRFLLCVIDICSKYTWVIALNRKKVF